MEVQCLHILRNLYRLQLLGILIPLSLTILDGTDGIVVTSYLAMKNLSAVDVFYFWD